MPLSLYMGRSKIRQELLRHLFAIPVKTYYLSELSRMVQTSPGNVQRELNKFVHDGLLNIEKKGNLNFYAVNSKHPLYEELDALISKTVGVESCLRNFAAGFPEICFALLYGSFPRGKEKGTSDIDLIVVFKKEPRAFYKKLRALEIKLNREINPTVYSSQEWANRLKAPNVFLRDVLRQPHKILKGNWPASHENP